MKYKRQSTLCFHLVLMGTNCFAFLPLAFYVWRMKITLTALLRAAAPGTAQEEEEEEEEQKQRKTSMGLAGSAPCASTSRSREAMQQAHFNFSRGQQPETS